MRLKTKLPQLPSIPLRQSQSYDSKHLRRSKLQKAKKPTRLSPTNNAMDNDTSQNLDNSFEKYYDVKQGIFRKDHLGAISVPKPIAMLREGYTLAKTERQRLPNLPMPLNYPQIASLRDFKLETEHPRTRLQKCLKTIKKIEPGDIHINSLDLSYPKDFIDVCKEGNLMKVKLMLSKDPSLVASRDPLSMSPLHWAALRGYTSIVKRLIKNKAPINALDCVTYIQRNRTPLHIATQKGYLEIVEILINSSADPSLFNNSKKLPIHLTKDNKILNAIRAGMKVRFI